jgi:hypothetical protein
MNRFILGFALSAFAGLGDPLSAQESETPSAAKVLILQNQRIFEGAIEKVGDFYRVRCSAGELTVPVGQGLRLCADWEEAIAFMRANAKLSDPDERLRLAHWCHVNHHLDSAREEARAAHELRPNHALTEQFLKLLEQRPAARTAPDPAATASQPPVPPVNVTYETVTAFNHRVQPILMNTCASCHSGSYRGKFRLYRMHEGGERTASQRNLAAVIAQINLDHPPASPLIAMALSAHGNSKSAPLLGKQSPTFLALCAWIDQTLADNPNMREKSAAPPLLPGSSTRAPDLPKSVSMAGEKRLPQQPGESQSGGSQSGGSQSGGSQSGGSQSGGSQSGDSQSGDSQSGVSLPGVIVSTEHGAAPSQPPVAAKTAPRPAVRGPRGEYDPDDFNAWAHPNKK